jgi:hypothetical protein
LLQSWIPKHIRDACSLSLEFRCVRKDERQHAAFLCTPSGAQQVPRDHVYAGKLRRNFDLNQQEVASDMTHTGMFVFCAPGEYAVSACALISRSSADDIKNKEVWWAPVAQAVVVEAAKFSAQ